MTELDLSDTLNAFEYLKSSSITLLKKALKELEGDPSARLEVELLKSIIEEKKKHA